MKPNFKLLIIFSSLSICLSCSEDDNDFARATTIKVINMIKDVDHVIVKTGENTINYATVTDGAKVAFENFKNFSIEKDVSRELTIVPERDTLNTIYSESLSLKGVHSLYLSGSLEHVESQLLEDNVKQFSDSIVGIRFINLSQRSGSVNIGVVGDDAYIVSELALNAASDYIEFPAKRSDGSYTFEFLDTTGSVSRTIFIFNPLGGSDISTKKNLTLVITEKEFPFSVRYRFIRINNY